MWLKTFSESEVGQGQKQCKGHQKDLVHLRHDISALSPLNAVASKSWYVQIL